MKKVNYHIHTTFSDGGQTVSEIVKLLHDSGVESFSITDHDSAEGNFEAERLAKLYEMEYFSGIELSCCFDGELGFDSTYICHVLGLGINAAKMQAYLEEIDNAKSGKINEMIDKMRADGYKIFEDGVPYKIHRREVVARELIDCGYAKDMESAYFGILNSEYKTYAKNTPTIKEGIKIIKDTGGIAVLSHPFCILKGGKREIQPKQVMQYVEAAKGYGVDGIEVYYQQFSPERIRFLQLIADSFGLLKSIGTDYHNQAPYKIKYPEFSSKLKRELLYFDCDGIQPDYAICGELKRRGQ